MSCEDERSALDAAQEKAEDTDITLENARRKIENRLKAAGVVCVGGAFGGPLGGLACLGALLVADDAAADFEAAVERSRLADERSAAAFKKYFMCSQRNELGGNDAVS